MTSLSCYLPTSFIEKSPTIGDQYNEKNYQHNEFAGRGEIGRESVRSNWVKVNGPKVKNWTVLDQNRRSKMTLSDNKVVVSLSSSTF